MEAVAEKKLKRFSRVKFSEKWNGESKERNRNRHGTVTNVVGYYCQVLWDGTKTQQVYLQKFITHA